jgi:hypothetical protein
MRNEATAALLVVAILAGAGAGYFVSTSKQSTTTLTSTITSFVTRSGYTETVTQTVTATSSKSSSPTTQTSCSITGTTLGVALRVVREGANNSLIPVADAPVSGGYVVYCDGVRQATLFAPTVTNSSGEVDVFQGGGGVYYLNVTYPQTYYPQTYHLSIPTFPVTATYVTFDITSGSVTTRLCMYGYNCSFGGT